MADKRQMMEKIIEEIADESRDDIKDSLREAFTLKKKKTYNRQITCKDCGKSRMYPIEIEIPDLKSQMNAISLALDQAKGKPKETVKVSVEIGMKALQEMSLDDLEAEERAILQAHPELVEKN